MSQAVNASRGLKKFVFYLILSAGLGLTIDHFIERKLQDYWRPVAANMRDLGMELTSPHMVYSRMGFPVFGARIQRAKQQRSWGCYKGTAQVNNIFVPISIYQLLHKRFKLGQVEIDTIEIKFIEDADCRAEKNKLLAIGASEISELKNNEKVSSSLAQKISQKISNPPPQWFDHLEEWFREREKISAKNPFSSLVVHSLNIEARNTADKQFKAEGNAHISFQDQLNADIILRPLYLRKKERSLTTEFKAQVTASEETIQVLADWAFHEGHFTVDLAYDKNAKAKIAVKSRDVPVSILNKWLDTPWSFQFLWLNCALNLETTKDQWTETPWAVSGCRMDGPNGKITLNDTSLRSLKTPEGLDFHIEHLDLDKIIHGREHFLLAGIFKNFGQLDGDVSVKQNKIQGALTVKNSAVVFSSNNKRKLQQVEEMKLTGLYNSGVYSLSLQSAVLLKGDFSGSVTVNYSSHMEAGDGRISIQKLSFDDEIEDLMLVGEASPISIDGKFKLGSKWRLQEASSVVSLREFKGQHVDLNALLFVTTWSPEKLHVLGTAAQMKVKKDGKGLWLYSSLLDQMNEKDVLSLSQTSAEVEYKNEQISLEKLTANYGPWKLEASGGEYKDGLRGSLVWQDKKTSSYTWKWLTRKQEMVLFPQTLNMRNWLRDTPDFLLENSSISLDEKEI